jgi:ribosome-binding protein aMBF1 (putative translation factor)
VLRGHALRDRRYELSLSSRKLCQALKISETDLSLLESNNLMAPSGFLPVLVKLGFYSQQTPPEAAPRTLSGRWLREQRRDKGISSAVVSQTVNTRQALVTLIEARDWPLPPEWIPALASLGLSEQGELSRRGAEKKESRSKKAAASPARSAVKPATKHATKDAAAAPPSELTGAWLRTERERLGLSQTALGQKLGISQSDMSRYELRDRRLPTEWWPLLKELGFAVPADLLSRLAQKLSDVLSRSAASTPASSATPLKAEKPAPKKGDAKAKALPKKAAKTDEEPQSARSEDLLQMIVEYRLSFGRRVGQSASEILSQIAQDLQLAGIGQSISHETLAAAMRQLFIAASRVRSKAS